MKTNPLRRDAVRNLLAQGFSAALQLACVPVLATRMGAEAYGLVGLFAAFEATAMLVDMTFSTTGTREIARRIESANGATALDVLLALERLYAAFGLALGTILLFTAPWLAGRVTASSLSGATIEQSLYLLALVVVLRAPVSLYRSAIQASQRHDALALAVAGSAAARYGGAILLTAFLTSDIRAFALWQAGCLAVEALASRAMTTAFLPARRNAPGAGAAALRQARPYMTRMFLLAATSLVLTQSDRVILALRASLTDLGDYNVAKTLSAGLLLAVAPLFTALFPRFSALHAKGDWAAIRSDYDSAATTAAALAGTLGSGLALFSGDALTLAGYAGAGGAGVAAAFLYASATMNAIGGVTYALQLGIGRNDLPAAVNLLGVPLMLALGWWLAGRWGGAGVAAAACAFSAAALVAGPMLTHPHAPALEPAPMWLAYRIALPCALAAAGPWLVSRLLAGAPAGARLAAASAVCVVPALWCWRRLGAVGRLA